MYRTAREDHADGVAVASRRVIVIRLQGGLGNQMFQYAHGRRLATATGRLLWLDLSWFDEAESLGQTPRSYQLGAFRTRSLVLPAWLARAAFSGSPSRGLVTRAVERFVHRVRESSGPIDPASLRGRRIVHLEGYWQGEAFFEPFAAAIGDDFRLAAPMTAHRKGILRRIGEKASVSVHVRRADYVTHPGVSAFHGTCAPEWYADAMARMEEHEPGCRFVVFSDDVPWSRANLPARADMIFVDKSDGRDYEDLHLMAACRHHIIANSSFSWWAAWLNRSPGKRVIAPRRWFLAREAPDGLLPTGWERL